MNCDGLGTTLESLAVSYSSTGQSYWKPGYLSTIAKPCPYRDTCAVGSTPNPYYEEASNVTCAPGRGVTGVYCLLCHSGHFFDEGLERCTPCAEEGTRVVLFMLCIVLIIVAIVLVGRYNLVARAGFSRARHVLVIAARQVSLTTKLKIVVSYYQIITQIDRVYAIVFPPAYANVVKALNSVFHVFFGWIPGVATACTGLGLTHELLLLSFTPLIIVLCAFVIVMWRGHRSTVALPFVLVVTFLCFPFVSSRGFRALAPCDCFHYNDGSAACFLHDAYSVTCVQQPSGGYAAPADTQMAAWIAIVIYACIVPILCAYLLFTNRRELSGAAKPTALSRALTFLSKDYQPHTFAWELVEIARKITVTGYLALVDPGSLMQLYLGVTVALCILILQVYTQPYLTPTDNFLSMVSASALVLTMLASLGIQLTELTPDLSRLGVEQSGFSGAIPLIVAVLITSALLVLLVALVLFGHQLNASRKLPIARWANDGLVANPRILPSGGFHAFVSHQWGSGQDKARAIKAQLTMLIPGLRVFLDVDDLTDIGALESLIDATDVVVVFLAGSTEDGVEISDYMRSRNCLRELRQSVVAKKRLVFVRETDQQHGAVSMAAHRRDCPEELRHVLDEHLIVPWYRVKEYGTVSLRQIAQVILDGELRVPGELLHAPLRLAPCATDAFHLYAPNAASELVALLRAEAPALKVTTNAEERRAAQRYVLYLNGATWETGESREEVHTVLTDNMPLLLVHEQRDGKGALPFSDIIERTPESLLNAGVYTSLAVPLYDGDEFQRVCLRVMVGAPPETPPAPSWRRSWLRVLPMWPRRSQVQVVDDDTPVMLGWNGVQNSARHSRNVESARHSRVESTAEAATKV